MIDSSLSVQAVSARAEVVLAVRELEAVNRHVSEVLFAADADADAGGDAGAGAGAGAGAPTIVSLALAITRAAGGDQRVASLHVQPRHGFGRLRARVAPCGPPMAALVALE